MNDKDIKLILDALEENKHYYMKSSRELEKRVTMLETYAKILSGGVTITIAGIAGLAFWFGGLRTTVSDASTKTDKVYQIVLENSDSLATRTKVIETKLDNIDKKLTEAPNPQRRR